MRLSLSRASFWVTVHGEKENVSSPGGWGEGEVWQITQFILTSLLKVCHQANPCHLTWLACLGHLHPTGVLAADLALRYLGTCCNPEAPARTVPAPGWPGWLGPLLPEGLQLDSPFPKATAATKALVSAGLKVCLFGRRPEGQKVSGDPEMPQPWTSLLAPGRPV